MKLRNRQLHPEFFQDETVAGLKPHTRMLFAGLWCIADREGRLHYNPAVIRGFIFPFEPKLDVAKMLRELHDSELVVQYEVENKRYLQIRNFTKYQNVHPNEAQSVIPMSLNLIEFNHSDTITKGRGRDKGRDKDKGKDKDSIPFKDIIDHLNDITGQNYKHTTQKNQELIEARWNEGFRLEDFKVVHVKKAGTWLGTKWAAYLRPITLYGTKFESYLNEIPEDKRFSETTKHNLTVLGEWLSEKKEKLGDADG
jgi:uncharacterized phage protein (TIGR02220 family)